MVLDSFFQCSSFVLQSLRSGGHKLGSGDARAGGVGWPLQRHRNAMGDLVAGGARGGAEAVRLGEVKNPWIL